MRLITVPGVFRPRSDSLLLARLVGELARPGARVLDPFTGSGVLAIAAARTGAEATAIDVSRRAVACAWLNARLNGVAVRALRGDAFGPVAGERFDLIAANPPYVPAESSVPPTGAARAWDAGPDGRAFVDRVCREARGSLAPGGRLLLVHSSLNGEGKTLVALTAAGLEAEVVARRKGPLGPLLSARVETLEARGLLRPGEREEEVIVFAARAPSPSVDVSAAGTAAACPPESSPTRTAPTSSAASSS